MTTFEPINRNHPNGIVTPFSISHESNEQKNYVKSLVDMVAHTINTIWPQPIPKNITTTSNSNTASLMTFLQHILKHSRTTHSTLQLALFYLFRIRPRMSTILEQLPIKDRPYVLCGRRMFLASLISAHKYLQDKTYKNKAWTQISGLPVEQINHAERIFLSLLDYQLYIKKDTYDHWLQLVQHQIGQPSPTIKNNHPIHEKKNHQPSSIDILSTPSLNNTPSSLHSSDNDFCSTPITPIMNDSTIHNNMKKRKMDINTIITPSNPIPSPKVLNQLPTPPSENHLSLPSFSTGEKRKWSTYLQ